MYDGWKRKQFFLTGTFIVSVKTNIAEQTKQGLTLAANNETWEKHVEQRHILKQANCFKELNYGLELNGKDLSQTHWLSNSCAGLLRGPGGGPAGSGLHKVLVWTELMCTTKKKKHGWLQHTNGRRASGSKLNDEGGDFSASSSHFACSCLNKLNQSKNEPV